MEDEPFAEQGTALLAGLADIGAAMEVALAGLQSQESIEKPLRELGLGYWSDTLYFDVDLSR